MPRSYVRRQGERVASDLRTKVYVPRWVDPFFYIQGSSIEKMVLTELVRRGIYFEHTPQKNPLPWFQWMYDGRTNPRDWEPDFLFPQFRIWLEIQGAYYHTLPGQVETDALRFAYIQSVGWRPIFWWEDDIRNRLQDLMNSVPEFYRVDARVNEKLMRDVPFLEGGVGIDHLAGLRKALRGRARPPQGIAKRYHRGKRRPK